MRDPEFQYGIRWGDSSVSRQWNGRTAKRRIREALKKWPGSGIPVRRAITYGDWEPIPASEMETDDE